jgi:hypothetical protein
MFHCTAYIVILLISRSSGYKKDTANKPESKFDKKDVCDKRESDRKDQDSVHVRPKSYAGDTAKSKYKVSILQS